MEITITIPEDKVSKFLAKYPKPETFIGSDADWIKLIIKRFLNRRYKGGLVILAGEE